MAKHLVIMAGGIGSRFWPMSTPQHPKQFIDITGCGRTMIQQSFDRFNIPVGEHAESIVDIDHLWVVTSANYKDLVAEQLTGINPQHILLEPCMRNTAPCVAYVSWKIQKEDPEALIVVAPSDHLVMNVEAFQEYIRKGFEFVAHDNRILTLGMTPTRPETGYGYIEQGPSTGSGTGIYELAAFREKPNLQTAIEYLQKGGFTWNSGMFMWSAKTIVNELREYAPQIAGVMDEIQPVMLTDKEQEKVNELFPTCEKISIDYAVMEKAGNINTIPAEFGWSDLGTWGSLHANMSKDADGNAVSGVAELHECKGCVVHTSGLEKVVLEGLEDYIVADTPDCEIEVTLAARKWVTRVIREFGPHIIVTHRPNDYHCDHRATATLVQDATYLVGVPLWCPDVPVPDVIPTVFYMGDRFTQPTPFRPDFVIDVSRHEERIVDTFACHESQMFEWLVPEHGFRLEDVPPAGDVEGRRDFIRKSALHLVADYAHAFADSVGKAYPGARPKLVEVYEKSEYGRAPVQAERDLLAALGGRWIDSTDTRWTQVK